MEILNFIFYTSIVFTAGFSVGRAFKKDVTVYFRLDCDAVSKLNDMYNEYMLDSIQIEKKEK